MTRKTWIMLKRGLVVDPKHREKMGIRIWLYLYMLDRANWQQGAVLEWRDESEAAEMEMDLNTLRSQRRQLEADGYIRCERRGHDQRVIVLRWVNPREYTGKVHNPPDLAGTAKEPSVATTALAESQAAPSDSQSGRSSDSQSRRSPQHLPLDSDLRFSDVTKIGGHPAAPQNLWVSVLGQLQAVFPKAEYKTWLEPTQVVSQVGGEIVVGTANQYAASWLESHAKSAAENEIIGLAGRPMSVRFVVLERVEAAR